MSQLCQKPHQSSYGNTHQDHSHYLESVNTQNTTMRLDPCTYTVVTIQPRMQLTIILHYQKAICIDVSFKVIFDNSNISFIYSLFYKSEVTLFLYFYFLYFSKVFIFQKFVCLRSSVCAPSVTDKYLSNVSKFIYNILP